MTEDAIYLMELFNMQIGVIKWELMDKTFRPERFDAYSYNAWTIQETVDAINSYEGLITVEVIQDVLRVQKDMYGKYYSDNEKQIRFKYAYDTVIYLLKLSGGCV